MCVFCVSTPVCVWVCVCVGVHVHVRPHVCRHARGHGFCTYIRPFCFFFFMHLAPGTTQVCLPGRNSRR
jgi:hypothetical protein